MKIICTDKEKTLVVYSFISGNSCPLHASTTRDHSFCKKNDCTGCIENNIEWEIKDGEQE